MNNLKIVIKKYENRRLYNTDKSCYVNLEDVAQMIRSGVEVQVLDARTGEDITRVVLTQIIVEEAKDSESVLPLDLLRQIVIATERAKQEFFTWYLRTALEAYQKAHEEFQSRMSEIGPSTHTPFGEIHKFLTPQAWVPGFTWPSLSTSVAKDEHTQDENVSQSEVAELRQRLEELEKRLEKKSAAAKRKSVKRR